MPTFLVREAMRWSPNLFCICLLVGVSSQAQSQDAQSPRLVALSDHGGCVVRQDGAVDCFGIEPVLSISQHNLRLLNPPARIARIATTHDLGCVLTEAGELSCFGQVFYDSIRETLMDREVRCDNLSNVDASRRCVEDVQAQHDTAALRFQRVATGVSTFAVERGVVCYAEARSGNLRCRVLDPNDAELRVLDDLRWNVRTNGRAQSVCAARDRACALDHRGKIWCWGDEAVRFSLLRDPLAAQRTPQNIAQVLGARAISCESERVCVLDGQGAVHCTALPGTAIDGTQALQQQPNLPQIQSIQSATTHSCAQATDGSVLCWGSNEAGGLGTGDLRDRASPSPVLGFHGASTLALGAEATCAVVANQVLCAGDARNSHFGNSLAQIPRRFEVLSSSRGARSLGFGPDGLPCVRGADGAWSCSRLHADEAVVSLQRAFDGAGDIAEVRYGCLLRESGRLECGTRTLENVVLFDATSRQAIALDRSGQVHRFVDSILRSEPLPFRPLLWRGAPVQQLIATGADACFRSEDGRLTCDFGGSLMTPRAFRDFPAAMLSGSAGYLCARQSTGPLRCARPGALRYTPDAESLPDPGTLDVQRNRNELCSLLAGELQCTAGESRFALSNVSTFRVSDDSVCALLRDGTVQCSAANLGEWMVGTASFLHVRPQAIRLNDSVLR